jgi:hypothetical protein
MPSGEKSLVNLLLTGRGIEIHTFMPEAAILHQIRPAAYPSDVYMVDPVWAIFNGVNIEDEPVIVQQMREDIRGFIIAPFLRRPDLSQARAVPPMGRVIQ